MHHSSTLVLDPNLPCNRIAFNGDHRSGFIQTKVQCSPTALVTPRYVPDEDRMAVATTAINLGSELLIIRRGGMVAKVYHPSSQGPEDEAQGTSYPRFDYSDSEHGAEPVEETEAKPNIKALLVCRWCFLGGSPGFPRPMILSLLLQWTRRLPALRPKPAIRATTIAAVQQFRNH